MSSQQAVSRPDPIQLIQALGATDDPVEKSAISAEFAIDHLPPPIAELARSCAILRWFDEPIIGALLPLVAEQPDGSTWDEETVYSQITSLTFVEHLAWGKVYHSQTAEGLIAKYGTTEPERFRAITALAAPAYLAHPNSQLAQSEALYCYLVADQQELARDLLDELALAASRREDWHRVLGYYQLCDQAAEFSFVTPLAYSATDYFTRALAAQKIGNLKTAIADYDRAIQLNPEFTGAYYNRGIAYRHQGRYAQAIASYDRAMQLSPEHAAAYYNRGNAYSDQGHYEQAIADYDRAIQLNPEDATAYSNRGLALRIMERWAEAEVAHKRALKIDGDRWQDWLGLAYLAQQQDNIEACQEAIARARSLADERDLYNMACLESIAGNNEAALDWLAKAVDETPHYKAQAQRDPDLAWIRDEARFWEIVGERVEVADE